MSQAIACLGDWLGRRATLLVLDAVDYLLQDQFSGQEQVQMDPVIEQFFSVLAQSSKSKTVVTSEMLPREWQSIAGILYLDIPGPI